MSETPTLSDIGEATAIIREAPIRFGLPQRQEQRENGDRAAWKADLEERKERSANQVAKRIEKPELTVELNAAEAVLEAEEQKGSLLDRLRKGVQNAEKSLSGLVGSFSALVVEQLVVERFGRKVAYGNDQRVRSFASRARILFIASRLNRERKYYRRERIARRRFEALDRVQRARLECGVVDFETIIATIVKTRPRSELFGRNHLPPRASAKRETRMPARSRVRAYESDHRNR
jgi:hypothetical protein